MLKVYDIETGYGDWQTHSVVAESMADAEAAYLKRYKYSTIRKIALHSEYVILAGDRAEYGEELSDEEVEQFKGSLQDIEAGRIVPLDEILKEEGE